MSDLLMKLKSHYSNKFLGAGIYAIYYTGNFPAYKPLAEQSRDGNLQRQSMSGKQFLQGRERVG